MNRRDWSSLGALALTAPAVPTVVSAPEVGAVCVGAHGDSRFGSVDGLFRSWVCYGG